MPGVTESIATINSLVRTGLAVVAVGAIGVGGWYGYNLYHAGDLELQKKENQLQDVRRELQTREGELKAKQQQLADQQVELAKMEQEISKLNLNIKEKEIKIEKLDTALRLLKINRRVAWLTVVDQGTDKETKELFTLVRFVEVDEKGKAIDEPRQFRIKGDIVYIDNWVVKFDDAYVEQADIDRSTSLVLFRRIFGESQKPNDGFVLDKVGARPNVYGRGEPSEFEKAIWRDFWDIANDQAKARAMGIRAAHGEAPFIKLRKGKSYKIELRASDGLSITPDDGPPPVTGKPAA